MKSRLISLLTLGALLLVLLPLVPASPVQAQGEVWELKETKIYPPGGTYEFNETPVVTGKLNVTETSITITSSLDAVDPYTGERIKSVLTTTFTLTSGKPLDTLTSGEVVTITVTGGVTGSGSISRALERDKQETLKLRSLWGDKSLWQGENYKILKVSYGEGPVTQSFSFVMPEASTPDDEVRLIIESTSKPEGRIARTYRPAADTPGTGVGSVGGLQAEKFFTIGWVAASWGEAYVQRGGKRIKMRKGMPIMTGDIVTTFDKGLASIELDDKDPTREAVGPSLINLASNTEMGMEAFRVFVDEAHGEPSRDGVFELIKAKMRVFTKGWGSTSSFSVKAGVSICGIRGSDVFISYDPDTERVEAYVIEGHMDVTNPETGETKSLTDNQKLVVENGKIGEIQPLSQAEWDSLVKENGVEDMQPMSQAELDRLLAEKNGESSGSSPLPVIIGVGAVMVAGFVFFGLKKRLKKA